MDDPPGDVRAGVLVLCEGPADALAAAQTGFRAVGVLGSSYPDRWIADTLAEHRCGAPLVVCFDGDAGADRLHGVLAERQVPTTVVPPPDRLDLTGWERQTTAWIEHLDPPRAERPVEAVAATPALGIGLARPSLGERGRPRLPPGVPPPEQLSLFDTETEAHDGDHDARTEVETTLDRRRRGLAGDPPAGPDTLAPGTPAPSEMLATLTTDAVDQWSDATRIRSDPNPPPSMGRCGETCDTASSPTPPPRTSCHGHRDVLCRRTPRDHRGASTSPWSTPCRGRAAGAAHR